MGRDKRLLRLAGVTLLERNLRFLQELFPTVALSVRDCTQVPSPLPDGVEIVPDVVSGSPLAGIASVLARFRRPVFVLAADIAFADRAAVERVVESLRRRRRCAADRRRPPGAAPRRLRPGVPAAHRAPARARRSQHPGPATGGTRGRSAVRRHPALLQRQHPAGLGAGAAPRGGRRARGTGPFAPAGGPRRRRRAGQRQDHLDRTPDPRAHPSRPQRWPRSRASRASTSTRRARTRGVMAGRARRPARWPLPRSSPS